MSITEIEKWKRGKERSRQVTMTLALHAAPLLRKSKVANIITVERADFSVVRDALECTDVSLRALRSGHGKVVLYLYRAGALKVYLSTPGSRALLSELGYLEDDARDIEPDELLRTLSRRISSYHETAFSFPHEIGLFLGYPIADVRGFIENGGQNCRYSGYWKVYGNVSEAKKRFARYERDRDFAVSEVIRGREIRDIAV